MTDPANFVNILNSTRPGNNDDSYKKVIEQIHKDGVCPFCTDYFKTYHKNPIIRETDFWLVTTNMYPYANAKHHFLLVLKKHKNNTQELTAGEWGDLHAQINFIVDSYKIPGGTLIMRCGDTSHTGATVTHLHAQFVSSDYENPNREPVLARVG